MYDWFADITDRIAEPPKWWGKGVPRYCDFDPHRARYGRTVLLVRVACQACGRQFDTAIGTDAKLGKKLIHPATLRSIQEVLGDPPHHLGENGYSCGGNGMLADEIAVLEAWEEAANRFDWNRRPDLEGEIPPNWEGDDAKA